MERSALQIIVDEFIYWEQELDERIREEPEDFEKIDETIREVSDGTPPLRENEIPKWIPTTHWWWYAPEQREMTDWERRMHFEYDWDDWRLDNPG